MKVSLKDESFVNIFTPALIIFLPANYILSPLYNILYGIPFDLDIGVFFTYLSYLVYYCSMMYFYTLDFDIVNNFVPKYTMNKYFSMNRTKYLAIFFLILSIIVYLPVLIEFKEYIFSPRDIYIKTRSGYGQFFFISLLLMNIFLVLSFFSFKRILPILGVYVLLAYLHGSKGAIIWCLLSYVIYLIYSRSIKFSFFKTVILTSVFSVFVLFVFYITFIGISDVKFLFKVMAGYSDYSRNAADLIVNYDNYFDSHFYGMLTFEENIFSRVPRFLYQDKPRSFGALRLSEAVYPIWFARNVGDASFGLVGRPFADFGYFSILYFFLIGAFEGIVLRASLTWFKNSKNIFYFIMFMFFAGSGFLPLGTGYLVFEHIVLGMFLFYLINTHIYIKQEM